MGTTVRWQPHRRFPTGGCDAVTTEHRVQGQSAETERRSLEELATAQGGIGGIAPSRRGDLAKLGVRALIAGTFASFLTANIAGMMI